MSKKKKKIKIKVDICLNLTKVRRSDNITKIRKWKYVNIVNKKNLYILNIFIMVNLSFY